MTPQEFIVKWKRTNLSERSAAQQHFLDLCDLLGQPKPAAEDPEGVEYTFEKGVSKTDGGDGWADVWWKGRFGWEYKGKHKDLKAAYQQLLKYRESLDNPPLLVVCDLNRFEIHTNFTGTTKKVYAFDLDGLAEPANFTVLRKVFSDPESLKPGETAAGITEDASKRFGKIADSMRDRGIDAHRAAHFLMKLIFCMFAEDIGLLPDKLFSKLLKNAKQDPKRLSTVFKTLFEAMARGGDFGADQILYFNGGLFAEADVFDMTWAEIAEVDGANAHNWADVEPSIFGTLFERTLDPAKRSQIGAHYTSREDILTLVEPVVMQPLRREWADVKAKCDDLWPKIQEESRKSVEPGTTRRKASKPRAAFDKTITEFVHRLAHVRILDPACGSGNFLYVAIHLLLDLEKEVIAYGAAHGLTQLPQVRPTQLSGIEINPYAQELAQVVIWIGYLQWIHHNGFNPPRDPVLDPIESIENRDAILDLSDPEHPSEPEWPEADFIIGNPPFLGDKKLRGELGDSYVDSLFSLYSERLPNQVDLCCYWFEKTRQAIERRRVKRAGLLATQGIRGGASREVVKRIKQSGEVFYAISDQNWILDGANVHVSMIGFDDGTEPSRLLNGGAVTIINANLTSNADISSARSIDAAMGLGFIGVSMHGPFDLSDSVARQMLSAPINPNGYPNSDVVRPILNAQEITRRCEFRWVVAFPPAMPFEVAAGFEAPFEFVRRVVKPIRDANRRSSYRDRWWIHGEARPAMQDALSKRNEYLATPRVSKHRVFVRFTNAVLPSDATVAFAFDDDFHFGVLQSRLHEVWALAQGTQVRERESGFRYTPTTCFETFPFPETSDNQRALIADAAKELDRIRINWLSPPEWTREELLEFPGSVDGPWKRFVQQPNEKGIGTVRYPRLIAQDAETAKQLAKRTLTNLYNQRPTLLDLAHRRLDEAVSDAYGWKPDLTDDEILEKLLALNLERAAAEK